MSPVENKAKLFLEAYFSNSKEEYRDMAYDLMCDIRRNEWQFCNVEHKYLMAKALYYLLVQDDEEEIPDDLLCSIYKLIYCCLLKGFIETKNLTVNDTKYGDLIATCQLSVVVIFEQAKFLQFSVLGEIGFVPGYVHKHIKDQLMLFCTIVKEAEEKGFHCQNDSFIDTRFKKIYSEIYPCLPSSETLVNYKKECSSVMEKIVLGIEQNLKDSDDSFFDD